MTKTVKYYAQSILLNAMICLTYVITMEFLSYAIKLAIDVGNNFPGNSSLAALDRFSSTKGHARVKQFHTFGSNCFVLGPKLCQNKYIPK